MEAPEPQLGVVIDAIDVVCSVLKGALGEEVKHRPGLAQYVEKPNKCDRHVTVLGPRRGLDLILCPVASSFNPFLGIVEQISHVIPDVNAVLKTCAIRLGMGSPRRQLKTRDMLAQQHYFLKVKQYAWVALYHGKITFFNGS